MRRREFLAAWLAAAAAGAAGRIRLGCQTRAYGSPIRERDRLLAVLEDLSALGYEGFETNFASLEHSFGDPEPMRREIAERRIALIGLHVGGGTGVDRIAGVARAVKGLGGSYVILSSSRTPAEALPAHCRELRRAAGTVRAAGVQLCFHNHTHELEDGARHFRAVLAETDLPLVLDVGNRFPPEMPALEVVRKHGRRIAAFHLRDTVDGKEVLMGSGQFDFAGLGNLLRETGWGGWLILEINRRGDMPSRKLIEMARDHLRKTMRL